MRQLISMIVILFAVTPAFAELPVVSVLVNQSGPRANPLTTIDASLWTCRHDLTPNHFNLEISTAQPPVLQIALKPELNNDCGGFSRFPTRVRFELRHLPVLNSIILHDSLRDRSFPVYQYQLK